MKIIYNNNICFHNVEVFMFVALILHQTFPRSVSLPPKAAIHSPRKNVSSFPWRQTFLAQKCLFLPMPPYVSRAERRISLSSSQQKFIAHKCYSPSPRLQTFLRQKRLSPYPCRQILNPQPTRHSSRRRVFLTPKAYRY